MFLVHVDIDGTLRRISDQAHQLEYQYLPLLKSFDPPQMALTSLSGGWCKVSYGAISFSPDLFSSDWPVCSSRTSTVWPPAHTVDVSVYYTETTEAAAVLIFSGTGYRTTVDREGVEYQLYTDDIDSPLLDEALDYYGETVALPRAFGEVVHERPVRLPDIDGDAVYHLAGITGTRARPVTSVWDDGVGLCYVESAMHGFGAGDVVTIEAPPYDTRTTILEVVDIATFRCDMEYVSDAVGHAYKPGYWRVYVDGVPASSGVAMTAGLDAFYFLSAPTGQVTISWTGIGDDLADVAAWACTRIGLTLNADYARAASPAIGYWADSQRMTLEFLSELCATMTHLFWIDSTTLRLIDMGTGTVTRSITEYEFFDVVYERRTPAAVVSADVITRRPITDDTGSHVLETSETVSVLSRYKYGDETGIEGFHWKRGLVRGYLRKVMAYNIKTRIVIGMPITGDPMTPGEKIVFTDSTLKAATQSHLFVRGLSWDFGSGRVIVEGDGSLGEETANQVPTGLIVGWTGTTMPDDWRYYGGDSLDRYIIGAGGEYAPEEIGGQDGVLAASDYVNNHTGASYSSWLKTDQEDLAFGLTSNATLAAGAHNHKLFCPFTPAYQNVVLIIAETDAAAIPANGIVFSKSNSAPSGLSAYVTSGALLRSGRDFSAGADSVGAEIVSPDGAHTHGYQGQYTVSGSYTNNYVYEAAPDHTHTPTGSFSANIKTAFLRAWTKTAQFDLQPGMICMYDSLDIPAGWLLCDGTNGTPDLTDCFISLSDDGTAETTGDNTASMNYTFSSESHEHNKQLYSSGSSFSRVSGYHSAAVSHTHGVAGDVDYKPPFFAIVFIQKESV